MRPEMQKSDPTFTQLSVGSKPGELVPVEYQTARKLFLRGQIDAAESELLALLAKNSGPANLGQTYLTDAALLVGWCLIEKKNLHECQQWLERAVRNELVPATHPGIRILELNIQLFNEKYVEVQQSAEQLLTVVVDQTSIHHAELRLLLGAALRWQGKVEAAFEHVEFACSAFTVLDEPGRQSVAANFMGWTFLSSGRFTDAQRWFEKSLRINTKLGSTLRQAQNYQNLAIVCYKQGDYQHAQSLLQKELDLVPGHKDMCCRALIAMGNIQRLQGNYLAARGSLHEAYSLATEIELARETALTLEFLGDVHRDEDNCLEARRYYKRSKIISLDLADRGDLVMELLRREGECLDIEGRSEEAHFVLNEALELCYEVGDQFETAVVQRCLGTNSANLGRWNSAIDYLTTALSTFYKMGAKHESMIASHQLATVITKQIDTGNAGASSSRLLVAAWQHALAAYQISNELGLQPLKDEIRELVNLLAQRRSPDRELPQQSSAFATSRAPASRVIAVSEAMQNVLRSVDGFARFNNPVLLTGECGSGKKLLARRLHENSPRGAFPFIRICCAATATDILANELFGHSSGNGRNRCVSSGLIAQAEGGTILLDGIGDLPGTLQSKIARLLQDGIYRIQGDGQEHQSNVRIIATAGPELADQVRNNRFRKDLYFHLKQMSIVVPALRSRPEDILPLLDFFLTKLEGSTLTARTILDFQAMTELSEYHWPGGTSELESISQQSWLNRNLHRPALLRKVSHPTGTTLEFLEPHTPLTKNTSVPTTSHPSGMTFSSLNSLISRANGNKTKVAKNLGISRITLYRWLNQLENGVAGE